MPRITDRNEIRSLLETDRAWSVYALGDLSPGLFEQCEWFRAAEQAALALLFRGFGTPVLFTLGEARAIGLILEEIGGEQEMYLSIRPEVLPLLKGRYAVEDESPMWRMILDETVYRPAPCEEAVRLSANDLTAVRQLYADGEPSGEAPDFFAPSMLAEGIFFGSYEGGALTAAAGTHLIAPAEGVAAIGNVYTRRDRRGQGLAARVTAAVTTELLRMGLRTIALNVSQHNAPALRVYERLGFARYCPFYEGRATRAKGFTSPSRNKDE
jgi:ribosomal protein S18 acetylase RimI-like enzyme